MLLNVLVTLAAYFLAQQLGASVDASLMFAALMFVGFMIADVRQVVYRLYMLYDFLVWGGDVEVEYEESK